jgi:hypothetical protein
MRERYRILREKEGKKENMLKFIGENERIFPSKFSAKREWLIPEERPRNGIS